MQFALILPEKTFPLNWREIERVERGREEGRERDEEGERWKRRKGK